MSDSTSIPKEKTIPYIRRGALCALLAVMAVFAGGEAWTFISFINYMHAGEPFIYLHGGPRWLVLAILIPSALVFFFRPDSASGQTAGARKAALWLAGIVGVPLLILLTPLLLGGGTIITEEVAQRGGYEACFWRSGAGSQNGGYLSWEVFYVPRESECLKLQNYAKEKFFTGITSQSALAGKQRIPISSR